MDKSIPKQFNTVGPCLPSLHYLLPVLSRMDVSDMIEGQYYYIIHGSRQSGKTTFIKALSDRINSEGKYNSLYCSLARISEVSGRSESMNTVVSLLNGSLESSNVEELRQVAYRYDTLPSLSDPALKVRKLFNYICRDTTKDLIVFFDEADSFMPSPLVTFLAQIREGYIARFDNEHTRFPRSMALVGIRDIRDYIIQVKPNASSIGVSNPFNIVKKSFVLPKFIKEEIQELYFQHTVHTGQIFDDSAIDRAWYWSGGQPWLVNSIARDIIVNQLKNKFNQKISSIHVDQASEAIIRGCEMHIELLLNLLKEPRVVNVMNSIISCAKNTVPINSDDRQYCIDFGLILKSSNQEIKFSNKIYEEIIKRNLNNQI